MTHRRDSDVYIAEPYGALKRKKTITSTLVHHQLPVSLAEGLRPQAPVEVLDKFMMQDNPILANKTQLLAWFCSNRITHGKRELYIKELSKYIPVHIYGQCGNMTCLPRNSLQCNSLLDYYKFYLSAENSLCPDYISEKFYRALSMDVIPVVYGGADYSQYAPLHSYISVADFKTPKDLANYLILLDKNDALYLKYFEWKKDWEVVRRPTDGWCELCRKLNDPNEPIKSYADMVQWWFDDVPCYPGTSFLKKRLPV
jgi:alpha-1,3-fucosyltransferase